MHPRIHKFMHSLTHSNPGQHLCTGMTSHRHPYTVCRPPHRSAEAFSGSPRKAAKSTSWARSVLGAILLCFGLRFLSPVDMRPSWCGGPVTKDSTHTPGSPLSALDNPSNDAKSGFVASNEPTSSHLTRIVAPEGQVQKTREKRSRRRRPLIVYFSLHLYTADECPCPPTRGRRGLTRIGLLPLGPRGGKQSGEP